MGVQKGFGVEITSQILRTVFAFGAWGEIGCSPCRESARPAKVKKSREVRANASVFVVFAWVFKGSKPFGSARCMGFGVSRFWPRVPGWLPGSCMLSPVLSLDRQSFEPCRNLIFVGTKLLGNYPSKET